MSSTTARRRPLTYAVAAVLALGATLVAVAPAGATYPNVVSGSSPIASYRLGEAAGTTMTDSSGNGHDGTYTGGVTLGGAPAITVTTDTSASFDGTGYGSASGVAAPTTAYTLEAWIKPADGSDGTIVGQVGGGQLFVRSGTLGLNQSGDDVLSPGPTLTPGTWWHVAATWDGGTGTTRLFVNGAEVATSATATTAPAPGGDVLVGSDGVATLFTGAIDEVAYYGSALPAATLADHVLVGTDATAPTITITTPTDKQHVVLHGFSPSYSCTDPGGSGIESCTATPGVHDLGPHLFTVQATDRAGNTALKSVAYVVDPPRYGDFVLGSNPFAYYRLDQAVGSTTMVDASGSGHDGILVNGAVTGSRRQAAISCEMRPHPPRSCELTNDPQGWSTHVGNRGYGYVNDVAAPRTAYTLEAWINPDDRGAMSIMGQGGAGQLYLTGDGHLALRQTQDDVVSSSPVIPVGQWTHVAATWNGSTTRLFVNGVEVATSNTANKAPSGFATLYVGQGEQAPWFRGHIDEAAFYAAALSTHVLRDHWMVGTAYDHPSITAGNSPYNTALPTIDTTSPVDNGLYAPTKVPAAAFTCGDPDGPGDIASCTATVDGNPIVDGGALPDSLGVHTFVVTATDLGGNVYIHPHTYTVETFADIYRADSPIAYYRLGDTADAMADASGNGRDGEYKNYQQSGPVGISGDGDTARLFWGDSGYGFSNGVAAARYQSTIEAWVNPDDARDQSIGGLSWSDELYIQGGRFVYRHLDDTVTADVGPTPGVFTQVVGVWDGAYLLIYVDGVLHGSGTPAAGVSSAGGGTFYVGFGTQEPWFKGALDEVAYYDTALTPDRVLQHFLADPPPPVASSEPGAGGTGCLVPELRGLRLRTAKAELEWANCSLGAVRTKRAAAWKRGYVLKQSVPANSVRRAGFPVRVVVGR